MSEIDGQTITQIIKKERGLMKNELLLLIEKFQEIRDNIEDSRGSPLYNSLIKICNHHSTIEDLTKQRQKIAQKKYKNSKKGKIKGREASLRYYHKNKQLIRSPRQTAWSRSPECGAIRVKLD
jgi:hypothetical protein